MFWYVLFVMTGYEHKVKADITNVWKLSRSKPFVPIYEACFKRGGKIYLEKRMICPGYVFVESDMPGMEFYLATWRLISQSEHILQLMRYGKEAIYDNFEMKSAEYEAFLHLYNDDYCIDMSKGFIVGDKVVITEGPLMGYESRIKKVRASKQEAMIEMYIMGQLTDVKVGLEILKKV